MRRASTTRRPPGGPQRFFPSQDTYLNRGHIRGPWRPTSAVAGCGVFAVRWSTPAGDFWAPLHAFDHDTQIELIAECEAADREAGYPGAWPWGR